MTCCLGQKWGWGWWGWLHLTNLFRGFTRRCSHLRVTTMCTKLHTHTWKNANKNVCKCRKGKTKDKIPHYYQPSERPPAHIRINWNSWRRFSLFLNPSEFGWWTVRYRNLEHLVNKLCKRPTCAPSAVGTAGTETDGKIFPVVSKRRHLVLSKQKTAVANTGLMAELDANWLGGDDDDQWKFQFKPTLAGVWIKSQFPQPRVPQTTPASIGSTPQPRDSDASDSFKTRFFPFTRKHSASGHHWELFSSEHRCFN